MSDRSKPGLESSWKLGGASDTAGAGCRAVSEGSVWPAPSSVCTAGWRGGTLGQVSSHGDRRAIKSARLERQA